MPDRLPSWRFLGALLAGAVGAWVVGCAGSSRADAPSDGGTDSPDGDALPPCEVEAPNECPIPAPTYADVSPIFEERCVVCHYGAVNGPWPLTDYSHISDWRAEIRAAMLACSMPPPDQVVEHMPDSERLEILRWIRCGLPK